MRSPEDDPLAALSNEIDQKWPDITWWHNLHDSESSGSVTETLQQLNEYPDPKLAGPKHPRGEMVTKTLAAGATLLLAKTIHSAIRRAR
jgi:hypothetical protein